MSNNNTSTSTGTEDEVPVKYLGKFLFTNKTATFGQKTLQLSNVSKIEVRSFKEVTKAVFRLSDAHLRQAWKGIGVGVLVIILGEFWETLRPLGFIITVICAGVLWYYYDERRRKTDTVYNYYGLFFDSTSGKTEVLWSDKQAFVVALFDRITNSMNYEQMSHFVANITDNSVQIQDSSHIVLNSRIEAGKMVIGDNSQ